MWRTIYAITRRGRSLAPAAYGLASLVGQAIRQIAGQNPMIEMLGDISGRRGAPLVDGDAMLAEMTPVLCADALAAMRAGTGASATGRREGRKRGTLGA